MPKEATLEEAHDVQLRGPCSIVTLLCEVGQGGSDGISRPFFGSDVSKEVTFF